MPGIIGGGIYPCEGGPSNPPLEMLIITLDCIPPFTTHPTESKNTRNQTSQMTFVLFAKYVPALVAQLQCVGSNVLLMRRAWG